MKTNIIAYNTITKLLALILIISLSWQAVSAASNLNQTGWIDANSLYINGAQRITSGGVGTFASGTTVNGASATSGSGTGNYLAYWTATGSTLGDSIVSQSTGSGNTLTVNGNISMPSFFSIGSSAISNNTLTVAIGSSAQATGIYSSAYGRSARATGSSSVAVGSLAAASGSNDIAIGGLSNASGANGIAIGIAAKTTANDGIAIGDSARTDGANGISIGYQANASNNYAQAMGNSAHAAHQDSIALGRNARTTAANQFIIGNDSTVLNTYIYGSLRANSSATTGSLIIGNASATHLLVNGSSGNVGIGTTTPGFRLQVGSGTTTGINPNTHLLVTDPDYARMGIAVNGAGIFFGASTDNTKASMFVYDYNAGLPRDLILNEYGGSVGIGTTSPGAKLDVNAQHSGVNTTGMNLLYNDTSGANALWASKTGLQVRAESNGQVSGEANLNFEGAAIDVIFNSTIDEGITGETVTLTGLSTTVNVASTSNDGADILYAYGNSVSVTGNIGTNLNDGGKIGTYSLATGTSYGNTGGHFSASGATLNTGVYGSANGGTTAAGGTFGANGGTSNHGIEIISPITGTDNYAIYSSATAKSYFAGNVGINTVEPTQKLHVDGSVNVTGGIYITASTIVTCNAAAEGLIYYNSTTHKHYGCNSTAWNAFY